VLAVNAAAVHGFAGRLAGLLDQEGAFEEDFAARAAACAFALAPCKQLVVVLGVDVGTNKPAEFAGRLPGAELET